MIKVIMPAAVVVLGLAVLFDLRPSGSASTTAPTAAARAPETSANEREDELEGLRRQVANLEQAVRELQQARTPEQAPLAQAARTLAEADEPAPEPPLEPEEIEADFARAAAATSGTQAAKNLAAAATKVLPEGSAIRSIECREAICRVETTHRGLGNYHKFLSAAFTNAETQIWTGPLRHQSVSEPADVQHGDFVAVSFLGQEGSELPRWLHSEPEPAQ